MDPNIGKETIGKEMCVYREREKEKGKERKNREKTKLFFILSLKKTAKIKNKK
jgi:hypothetical protein